MVKHTKCLISILIVLTLCLSSCKEDSPAMPDDNKNWTEYTVAVVLPMERGLSEHWERTLGLFSANFQSAFVNQATGVRLKFEYFDEAGSDIEEIASGIIKRDDIYACLLYTSPSPRD